MKGSIKRSKRERVRREAASWLTAIVLILISARVTAAQTSWFERYQEHVAATQVNQPHWATPLVTTNARVEQGIRTDFTRQTAPGGQTTWSYGNAQGLQIIPFARTELRFSPPSFFTHSDPRVADGFGDFATRVKTRLYGSNESRHNTIVTALLAASLPTGKQRNGSSSAILTPTLEFGKGFGKLALTTSAGGTLPLSNTRSLGRSITLNQAAQVHLTRLIWLETELNSTLYAGGRNDGQKQLFLTPGVVVSRIPLTRKNSSSANPLALTLGLGEQTALTHFHTYNHAPVFSARFRF